MTSAALERIAIVGCGLIGGSIARRVAAEGIEVFVRDENHEHQDRAVCEFGCRQWTGEPVDIVVVATPPASVVAVVHEIIAVAPNTPVTDVASVKGAIVAAIDSAWFVGGHPLAGASTSGPEGALPGLFDGRPWVTCPRQRANGASRAAVSALIDICGAREVVMSADEHDRGVAVTSHSVQVVASAIAAQWGQLPGAAMEARGRAFDEILRLAGSDPLLWQEILSANSGAVSHVLLQLADTLTEVADSLTSGDASTAARLIADGNEAAQQ